PPRPEGPPPDVRARRPHSARTAAPTAFQLWGWTDRVPLPSRRVSGLLTAADAAGNLGVELRVVQRALLKGYLQGEKRGNAWVIPEATLAQLAAAGPHPFHGMAPSHPAAWMPGFISAAD